MPARRTALLGALLCAVAAAFPQAAGAAFFGGQAIDGPSADIRSLGDVDVARDGSGALAYVKRDGGVDHIFVSRLVSGVWQPSERVDAGLDAASSDPVVAASDGGRLVVAYVSGGAVFVVVRPAGAPGFTAPALIAAAGSAPSADMSIQGVAYVSFTAPGFSAADVRVARADRGSTTFAVLADPLDILPSDDAGAGTGGHSRVAVSADGTAVVTWAEGFPDGQSHVVARRVFGDRISTAPQDLTADTGPADSPDIAIEDDSSYAWIVFRQQFEDGRRHAVARRLVGSVFDPPAGVDPLPVPAAEDAQAPKIAMNGVGQGIATSGGSVSSGAFYAYLRDNVFGPGARLDAGNGIAPLTDAGIAQTGDGLVAWQQLDAGVPAIHARFFDDDPASKTAPAPGPDTGISDPALGPVEAGLGFKVASNRAGDTVIAFAQGGEGARRIVVAAWDRPPGTFHGTTTTKFRRFARPRLSWTPSFDLWGPITYKIFIDGVQNGQTTDTTAVLPNLVADGKHFWKVTATDPRGQTVSAPSRLMRIDATPPRVTARVGGKRRRGAAVRVSVTARDVLNPGGSGVAAVRISFGDGSAAVAGKSASHRYSRSGRFTLTVTATDKAGNVAVVSRRIRIKR